MIWIILAAIVTACAPVDCGPIAWHYPDGSHYEEGSPCIELEEK